MFHQRDIMHYANVTAGQQERRAPASGSCTGYVRAAPEMWERQPLKPLSRGKFVFRIDQIMTILRVAR